MLVVNNLRDMLFVVPALPVIQSTGLAEAAWAVLVAAALVLV
ncbi:MULTISPECIES: hypothetical protein [unclassified Nocardioides]|nr:MULTISPECIES: hypothetical protein [unclassified Nocardioides]